MKPTTRERAILLSQHEVLAILAGRKTQRRDVVRLTDGRGCGAGMACLSGNHAAPLRDGIGLVWRPYGGAPEQPMPADKIAECCPYGNIGDRLWGREKHSLFKGSSAPATLNDADYCCFPDGSQAFKKGGYYHWDKPVAGEWPTWNRWRSPIHMPRWASRITLEITNVRVERLQAISEADALAEGIQSFSKDGRLYKFGHIEPGDPGSTPWVDMCRSACEAYGVFWDARRRKPGESWGDNPWVWARTFKRVEANS